MSSQNHPNPTNNDDDHQPEQTSHPDPAVASSSSSTISTSSTRNKKRIHFFFDPDRFPFGFWSVIAKIIVKCNILVMVVSFLLTLTVGLVAFLAFSFQLEYNPSSFRVVDNPIADKYDSFIMAEKNLSATPEDLRRLGQVFVVYASTRGGYTVSDFDNNNRIGNDVDNNNNNNNNMDNEMNNDMNNNFMDYNSINSLQAKSALEQKEDEDILPNIFAEKSLERVHYLDQLVQNVSGYEDYCVRSVPGDPDSPCAPVTAMSNFFYPETITDENGTVIDTVPNGRGDSQVSSIRSVLERFTLPQQPYRDIRNLLIDRDFSAERLRSNATRIFLSFETKDGSEPTQDQIDEFQQWAIDSYYDLFLNADTDDVDLVFAGGGLTDHESNTLIFRDAAFAGGSAVVVLLVMMLHTGSIFLSVLGMIHILMSFPLCYFIFRVIIAMPRTNVLNFLGLFIILGIGADDVFIFVDAWKQSSLEDRHVTSSLERRLAWTYRRAVKAMSITTLTTFVAFIANTISIIPPIRYFGIFVGMLVAANFLFVCTWFPAAIIINHYTFDRIYILSRVKDAVLERLNGTNSKICRGESKETDVEMGEVKPSAVAPQKTATNEDDDDDNNNSNKDGDDNQNNQGNEDNQDQQKEKEKESLDNTEVQKHDSKKISKSDEDHDEDDDKDYRFIELFFYKYYAPTLYKIRHFVVIFFICITAVGIAGTTFLQVASEPAQFVPDWHNINKFFILTSKVFLPKFSGPYSVGISLVWGLEGIDRSTRDLADSEDFGTPLYDKDFSFTQPESQQMIYDLCRNLSTNPEAQEKIQEYSCFIYSFRDYLLSRNLSFPVSDPADTPQRILEWSSAPSEESSYDQYRNQISIDDQGNVSWFYLRVLSTLFSGTTNSVARPVYDWWTDLLDSFNDRSPSEMGTGFHASELWVSIETQRVLVDSAVLGIALSLVFVAVIILFATLDVLVTFVATILIAAIVVCDIGFMVAVGWDLGIIESICITILVGLAVDFVVHFAHTFKESRKKTRFKKMRQGLTELGVIFFPPATMVISGAFAFGAFPALMMIMGPESDWFSLRKWAKEIYKFFHHMYHRSSKDKTLQK